MSKINSTLTAERLRQVLDYDPEAGVFTWCVTLSPRAVVGTRAGTLTPKGYRRIAIDGVLHRASRLAWLYVHGCWPVKTMDHINRVRDDDRIGNLRDVSTAENNENKTPNKHGFPGVQRNSLSPGFIAVIKANRQRYHLGVFATAEEAGAAYAEARAKVRLQAGALLP